jgi:2-keto-4-pentenoate hydratase/2-oxohepta-3-ene-1,7-dioic acid hydratase in catechol pathway
MTTKALQAPAWSRLIRFIAVEDGLTYSGEPLLAQNEDIGAAFVKGSPPLQARILSRDDPLDTSLRLTGTVKTVKKLLSPLDPHNHVTSIRALGANFVQPGQDPIEAKSDGKRPKLPIVFYKPISTIIGHGADIRIPKEAVRQTDWEVELVVIIGKTCKNVKRENALDYVLGYTLSNDVSSRTRMFAVPQWGLGKSFDTFLPLGPCIISAASKLIPNPDNVDIKTVVNGKTMQQGNTENMLYGCAETIEWLSQGLVGLSRYRIRLPDFIPSLYSTTLEAGTIISM